MSGLQRRLPPSAPEAAAVDGVIPIGDAAFLKKFPTLAEFLTRVQWEPGVPREKGTFFIFYEHGVFKACINDKDTGMMAFVSSVTFTGLLDAIEAGLAKDNHDWRLPRPERNGRRR